MATKAAHSRANHGKSSAAATTTAPVTRGKRKLNFPTSTSTTSSTTKSSDMYFFRGKNFFLDLPGYNKIDQIEYELTERGGKVERRFHSGVKYLITNRQKGGRGVGGGSPQVDSPSTTSPNTPSGGASTRGGGRAMSKLSPSAESPGNNANPLTDAPGSRAALILAASQKGKKRSTDLRVLAEGWGCKVLSLTELLKELRKLKPLPKKESPSKKTPVVKVRKLKPPFLKVEDVSYSYRPLVYETRQWPHPDVNCSPKGCPFEVTKQGKSHRRHVSPKEGALAGDHPKRASSPEAAVAPPIEERRRPGYCECCSVRYRDLSLHLKSAKHLEYAHDDENFAALDEVIAKGTKFEDFVASVRTRYPRRCKTPPRRSSPRKTNSPYKTVVNLVTPPSPRPTKQARKSRSSSSRSPPRSPPRASNPAKAIVLDKTGVFVSPKRGQLCLTPVKDSPRKTRANCTPVFADMAVKENSKGKAEYTPGFTTPPPQSPAPVSQKTRKKGGGSRIDPVTRALLQNTDRVNTRLRLQKERETVSGGSNGRAGSQKTPVKNGQHRGIDIGDGVPETPEKVARGIQHRRKNGRSPLVKFKSLVECIAAKAAALSKAPRKQRFVLASDIKALVEEITHNSSSSPVHSTPPSASSPLAAAAAASAFSSVRKSPRLVEKELQRFRPSVTTRTERVLKCRSAATLIPPSSLTVSYDLNQIYPRYKRRSAIVAEQAILTPKTTTNTTTGHAREEESVTPEIEFQGDPSTLRKRNRRFSDRESPVSGLRASSCTPAITNRLQFTKGQEFFGFSADTIRGALPMCSGVCAAARGDNNHVRRSPRSGSKVSVDSIAMKLAARKMLINDLADEERERLGRKRGLDQSECSDNDGECEDPHLSPPPAKRRRVSFSEGTPSPTSLERPNRRSPRLAISRKLQLLSSH